MKFLELNDGNRIPMIGLGTFKMDNGNEVDEAVKHALKTGYRSIDTAAFYGNEEGVGEAIRESGVPRKDIFVTTKLWTEDEGYESAFKAFEGSLERLGLDYVDLYLIHWPVEGKYMDSWRALLEIKESGRARSVGVSNFMIHHLRKLLSGYDATPSVNQVELHPGLYQKGLMEYCREKGIKVEAWSPIKRGQVSEMPEMVDIAQHHGKSPAQVAIRWEIQHGAVTIPKSSHAERIEENLDVFDFELSRHEMERIDSIGNDQRIGPDPDNFSF